jgi:hypothetical protein
MRPYLLAGLLAIGSIAEAKRGTVEPLAISSFAYSDAAGIAWLECRVVDKDLNISDHPHIYTWAVNGEVVQADYGFSSTLKGDRFNTTDKVECQYSEISDLLVRRQARFK